jgi:HK97 family phage major capsid protein
VVTENGVSRIWGATVVETVGVEDFAGNATEERVVIVGDGRRGATLYDREQSSVSVGWINDQFIRNQRTILAEGRWAFGIPRPLAFRKYIAQAAVAS